MAIRYFKVKDLKKGFNEADGCLGKPKGIFLHEDGTVSSHADERRLTIPKHMQGIKLDTLSGKIRFVFSNEEAARRNLLIIVPNNAGALESAAYKLQKKFPDVEFWSAGTADYWRRQSRRSTGEMIAKAIKEKRKFHVFF